MLSANALVPSGTGTNDVLAELARRTRRSFYEALDDDLNSAAALGFVFELVREINAAADRSELPTESAEELKQLLGEVSAIFGLRLGATVALNRDVEDLVRRREELRKTRKFSEADAIRDELLHRGIVLEDTPTGVRWKKRV